MHTINTGVGGEVLDLSLNTSTASVPSSPSSNGGVGMPSSFIKNHPMTFPFINSQFSLDQVENPAADLFPTPQWLSSKNGFSTNLSAQPQQTLPLGAFPMAFSWTLLTEAAKTKEEFSRTPLNNVIDLSINSATSIPRTFPLCMPPLGLGDGLADINNNNNNGNQFDFSHPQTSLPLFNGILPESFQFQTQLAFPSNNHFQFPCLPVTTTTAPPQTFTTNECVPFLDGQWTSNPSNEILKKFTSFQECGNQACKMNGNREHFHCTRCEKIIIRREETIRHLKWHKKREESLQYGFMRYSPNDDCGMLNCSHNKKQTHYHCLQPNCAKIYISTSDVQMHANYHKKDAVILQEGFRRYRSIEECGTPNCAFAREKTTHFHCRRQGCNFTFKNKADIEKHKNHHQKNDVFAKDGFRKFTKYEYCKFPGCKNSFIMNHIHCIRPGCDYVVHSSGQILSHKRKHDRRQILPMIHNMNHQNEQMLNSIISSDSAKLYDQNGSNSPEGAPTPITSNNWDAGSETSSFKREEAEDTKPPSPVEDNEITQQLIQASLRITDLCWQKYNNNTEQLLNISEVDATLVKEVLKEIVPSISVFNGESCYNEQCSLASTGADHFHCYRAGCMDKEDSCTDTLLNSGVGNQTTLSVGDLDAWKKHWLTHAWQSTVNSLGFILCSEENCKPLQDDIASTNHIHCRLWPECDFSAWSHVAKLGNPALAHHWLLHNVCFTETALEKTIQTTSNECLDDSTRTSYGVSLPRKRGRPPKHSKDIHVPRLELRPELCFDQNPTLELTRQMFDTAEDHVIGGSKFYPAGMHCIDTRCQFFKGTSDHYHCVRPRCHMATASLFVLNAHRSDFHPQCEIKPGYEYFDHSIDCRRPACSNKRETNHFHCVWPRCDYTFVRPSKMPQHTEKHNSRPSEESVKLEPEEKSGGQKPLPPPLLPLGMAKNQQSSDFRDLFSLLANLINQTTNKSHSKPPLLQIQHNEHKQQKMDCGANENNERVSTVSSPTTVFPETRAAQEVISQKMEWTATVDPLNFISILPNQAPSTVWNGCRL